MPFLLELEKNTEKDIGLLLKIARIYLSIHQNARADHVLQKVIKIEPGNREAKELISQCL
jgi:TolA-binding protein